MMKTLSVFCILVFSTGSAAFAQNDPRENLVHSYTFEDGTADDEVGTAHGTLVGAAEVANGALIISGQGQWVTLPGSEIALNSFSGVTLEILYTPEENANTGFTMLAYFGRTVGGVGADYFFISTARGDDVSRAAISIGAETEPWAAESGANGPEYDDDATHHMVATLTDEEISLYIDGTHYGTTELAAHNSIGAISTDLAFLARGGYDADPAWIGAIHQFNIYDRALTSEEVAIIHAIATSAEAEASATQPQAFSLSQNYPNPFNPSTTLEYAVAEATHVRLAVYDVLGREVAVLVNGQRTPGQYRVIFDATGLPGGLYFGRMQADGFRASRALVLMK